MLSADTVVDQHLDPLSTVLFDDPRDPDRGPRYFLQTSPEFAMKRLLATGGQRAIYQVTHAFRGAERGRLHNPEFTMVEWYRVGDSYDDGMLLLSNLIKELLGVERVERISYRQAFLSQLGIDPFLAPTSALADAGRRVSTTPPAFDSHDRDGWLNFLLAESVEPQLGFPVPTILFDYPASQSALARVRTGAKTGVETGVETGVQGDPDGSLRFAERFELYVRGIELANGYHELLDAPVLEERNRKINSLRMADGKPELPESSRLLDAMRHGLPPCTGVAMGFDRLAMLHCNATAIDEVLTFPIDRA